MVMKRLLVPIVVVASLLAAVPSSVFAEPAEIEEIIKLLHEAKASAEPLPLLEKAHAVLKGFNPVPARQPGAPRKNQGNKAAAQENKGKAMEAIGDAIKVAKEGGVVKPKIEHAVAMAHKAGDLKQ